MTWYVVQHKPGQGERALHHLRSQGVVCFFPTIKVEKIMGGKRTLKVEPLFPGYIFISLKPDDAQWGKLRSTRGVLRVVSFAHKPAEVPDEVVAHLKSRLDMPEASVGLEPGQRVSLSGGAFAGIDAVFESYDGEERAIVFINFMQTQQRVNVPISDLHK